MNIRIAIGVDHRGYDLKKYLISKTQINSIQIDWHDVGTFSNERTDYPVYTKLAIDLVLSKKVDLAVLACGSGIGMSIAANRYKRIYAGLVWNVEIAKMAKEDDNVNVLILPADFVTLEDTVSIISAWLTAKFKGDRYEKRLQMIDGSI